MKLIIITSPDFLPGEARILTELFKAGLIYCIYVSRRLKSMKWKVFYRKSRWNIEAGLLFMTSSF